jgi:hypothetical protein
MFTIHLRLRLYGLGLWMGGTLALRLFGQRLLHPERHVSSLALLVISFVLMAWLLRRLCARLKLPREQWPIGAISVALPTLLLDPFSSAFFPEVFPNIEPSAAGLFGGWMLCCCAGAMAGAVFRK